MSSLNDENGKPSSMRLMAVTALWMSFALAIIASLKPDPSGNGFWLSLSFVGFAFTGKSAQKFLEMMPGRNDPK
jgi:hypothetical protein